MKKPKLSDGKEQLKSYCNATGAPIGVWTNGEQISCYRNTHYRIERRGERVTTHICKKSNEAEIYFHFEQESYDELALDAHPTFLHLSEQQRMQCKAFYREICPYVTESILTRDRENKIVFIEERAKVSRGIIEVLYLLRCSLMHGEVSPNDHTNEVYKYAYNILAAILKRLA